MSETKPFIHYEGNVKERGDFHVEVNVHGSELEHILLTATATADVIERYARPGTEKRFILLFVDQVAAYLQMKKSTVDVETVDYIKKILKGDETP